MFPDTKCAYIFTWSYNRYHTGDLSNLDSCYNSCLSSKWQLWDEKAETEHSWLATHAAFWWMITNCILCQNSLLWCHHRLAEVTWQTLDFFSCKPEPVLLSGAKLLMADCCKGRSLKGVEEHKLSGEVAPVLTDQRTTEEGSWKKSRQQNCLSTYLQLKWLDCEMKRLNGWNACSINQSIKFFLATVWLKVFFFSPAVGLFFCLPFFLWLGFNIINFN